MRIKKDDPTAKSKLNKTLQKIREQSEKEEVFYQYIDEADTYYDDGEYQKSIETYKKANTNNTKFHLMCAPNTPTDIIEYLGLISSINSLPELVLLSLSHTFKTSIFFKLEQKRKISLPILIT